MIDEQGVINPEMKSMKEIKKEERMNMVNFRSVDEV